MRTTLSVRRAQFQRIVYFGHTMPLDVIESELKILSASPDPYSRVKRAAYLRLIVCRDKAISGLPYQQQKTATRFNLGMPNPRWVPADGYTKDLLDGAIFMATFGGHGSRFARYDMTICEHRDGTVIPVHGMKRMAPVESVEAAKAVLLAYWFDLPDRSKVAYTVSSH